jgi:hypothetical protein
VKQKFFKIPVASPEAIEADLNAFCDQHRISNIDKHFVADGANSFASHVSTPQRGLPIGSLTSQYFANYYLDGLDRLLADSPAVRTHIRYMDDIIWWCDSREVAQETLQTIRDWLQQERGLQIKPNVQIQPSKQGVTYCGFRILQGAIRLSRRRKRRYQQRRQYWEQLYLNGKIDANQLQLAHAAVHAITAGTVASHGDRKTCAATRPYRYNPIG